MINNAKQLIAKKAFHVDIWKILNQSTHNSINYSLNVARLITYKARHILVDDGNTALVKDTNKTVHILLERVNVVHFSSRVDLRLISHQLKPHSRVVSLLVFCKTSAY